MASSTSTMAQDSENLIVGITNIRNISKANIVLPFDNGIYALVGVNGSGKSTLMECISFLLSKNKSKFLFGSDSGSVIGFKAGDNPFFQWTFDNDSQGIEPPDRTIYRGLYEGSLFYGTRFEDSKAIDNMISSNLLPESEIADADLYVKEKLSFILHGDTDHYKTLKRIKNRRIADSLGLNNLPYFIESCNVLISQYRMSSGECLLISLLHFLYNSIERRSLPTDKKALVLIDELELALHPIAVHRLLQFLGELIEEHDNLVVYISTHSAEIIRTLRPSQLFKVETIDGILTIENNCYPSYLIRDLYCTVAPDFLLLVEDTLAQLLVENVLRNENLRTSKLIHCVPVGGWKNVLALQNELTNKHVLGLGTKIISILDGDVENSLTKAEKKKPHMFLPVSSVEKFLYGVIKENNNPKFRKILADKYFTVKSLNEIVSEYNKGTQEGKPDDNKNFWNKLVKELSAVGITEQAFLASLTLDISQNYDLSKFLNNLKDLMEIK